VQSQRPQGGEAMEMDTHFLPTADETSPDQRADRVRLLSVRCARRWHDYEEAASGAVMENRDRSFQPRDVSGRIREWS
jgi:hypothetical protein